MRDFLFFGPIFVRRFIAYAVERFLDPAFGTLDSVAFSEKLREIRVANSLKRILAVDSCVLKNIQDLPFALQKETVVALFSSVSVNEASVA